MKNNLKNMVVETFVLMLFWIFIITMFATLPLWIIPYKIWEKKGGAE